MKYEHMFDDEIEWWKLPTEEELIIDELERVRGQIYEAEKRCEELKKLRENLCIDDK